MSSSRWRLPNLSPAGTSSLATHLFHHHQSLYSSSSKRGSTLENTRPRPPRFLPFPPPAFFPFFPSLSLLLLLKSEADWIGKCFIIYARLYITFTYKHRERERKTALLIRRKEKQTSALLSHRLYTSLFLLYLKQTRKESNFNIGFWFD